MGLRELSSLWLLHNSSLIQIEKTVLIKKPSLAVPSGIKLATWVQQCEGIKIEAIECLSSGKAHNRKVPSISASGRPNMVHLKVLELTGLHQILYSMTALLWCWLTASPLMLPSSNRPGWLFCQLLPAWTGSFTLQEPAPPASLLPWLPLCLWAWGDLSNLQITLENSN